MQTTYRLVMFTNRGVNHTTIEQDLGGIGNGCKHLQCVFEFVVVVVSQCCNPYLDVLSMSAVDRRSRGCRHAYLLHRHVCRAFLCSTRQAKVVGARRTRSDFDCDRSDMDRKLDSHTDEQPAPKAGKLVVVTSESSNRPNWSCHGIGCKERKRARNKRQREIRVLGAPIEPPITPSPSTAQDCFPMAESTVKPCLHLDRVSVPRCHDPIKVHQGQQRLGLSDSMWTHAWLW